MITTIISFITGTIIPIITKALQNKAENTAKQAGLDNAVQIAQIQATSEAVKAQANAEAVRAQADAEVAKSANEFARATISSTGATGIKWIDASINLVRALFGFGALAIFLASGINLWFNGSPLLQQPELSAAFFIVLGFFFGERCVKKAWGK
jgi:uncharacterized membrane protein YraQ (UPF0718 family)